MKIYATCDGITIITWYENLEDLSKKDSLMLYCLIVQSASKLLSQ